jgi:Asp-tRNA(Asn)/Glu-tRNA(Gln) amidotransferase A subunit family amidase/Asp-tRNA(Asn)/Glu-tRNA(Gln) amidotransferase C subunit
MDRREFTAFFAASGLGGALLPGVLWGIVQGQERVTREMVERAEKIAGLEFTDEQRERIARGLSSNLRAIEQLREVKLPNEVPPALRFNPVLPGMRLRMLQREMRRTQPAVQRPERLEDVAFWPVTHLAELVRTRQVMPSELVKMYLARIRRFDPQLHAVVTLTEERALEQAARLDADLRNGIWHGPLHGIPWGAKDLLAARGYPTTWGASPYREQMIDDDATVVERLDGAGAVLIAKLTLGALAQGDRWFGGMTRNPWAPAEGSSGSSAGPGAATAAGLVGFSIGTETLGSIVSPAARNGVTGLRPTFGRVSRHGAMALSWSMDKIGPMCRTVEDCALVLDAICGPDERDPTVRAVPFSWDAERPLSSLRVGYDRLGFEQADPAGERNAFDQAALAALRALIPNLEPVTLPTRDYPLDAIRATVLGVEAAAAFDELTRSGRDALLDAEPERSAWPNTFRTARFVSAVEYINANRVRTLVMDAMDRALGNIDVIISPAVSALLLTNLTGHPQIALPAGFTQRNGTDVPVTITFIGRLYDEDRLLTVAKAWQDATGHHLRRPPVFS